MPGLAAETKKLTARPMSCEQRESPQSNGVAFEERDVSSVFLVVKPSKIIFLINIILRKEDIILLYNGYHSIM